MASFTTDDNSKNAHAAPAGALPHIQHAKRRWTPQRTAILQVLRQADTPLAMTQILAEARHILPRLSREAVGRNLRLLQAEHQVKAVAEPRGETRYQMAAPLLHNRFCCRKCDKIFELQTCPILLMGSPHLPLGFVVETYVAMLYGLCANCAQSPAKTHARQTPPPNTQNGMAGRD